MEASDGTDTATVDVEVTVTAPAVPSIAQAFIEVVPTGLNSSTYSTGSFEVTNQSDAGCDGGVRDVGPVDVAAA